MFNKPRIVVTSDKFTGEKVATIRLSSHIVRPKWMDSFEINVLLSRLSTDASGLFLTFRWHRNNVHICALSISIGAEPPIMSEDIQNMDDTTNGIPTNTVHMKIGEELLKRIRRHSGMKLSAVFLPQDDEPDSPKQVIDFVTFDQTFVTAIDKITSFRG